MDQLERKAIWPGWETVRLIGRGSFGAVYEIERKMLGSVEKAALKVISIPQSRSEIDELLAEGYDEASVTERFKTYMEGILREYALMAKVKGCANIVYCDDVRSLQHEDGVGWDIFIKMELLTPMMKALPFKPEEEQIIRVGRELCNALRFCEAENILHRDIKPQNIFVARDGTCKLGDFGVAKTVEKTSGGTRTGTYKYMAPEVFNNQPYGPRADIYSLGLVLYWLLNDRRTPFLPLPPAVPSAADEEEAKARRFRGETIPAPAHASPALQRIVLKACAYDPADRYAGAEEMMRDLERAAFELHNTDAEQEADDEATVSEAAVRIKPRFGFGSPAADPTAEESTVGRADYNVPIGKDGGSFPWEEEATRGLLPNERTPEAVQTPRPVSSPQPAPAARPQPAPAPRPQPAPAARPQPTPAPQPAPAPQPQPAPAPRPQPAPAAGKDGPKQGKSKLPLILGAVGVLAVALILIFVLSKGGSSTSRPASAQSTSRPVSTVKPATPAPAAPENTPTETEPEPASASVPTPAPVPTPSAEEYKARGFQATKDGLYWKLENGTLIISGAGKMADYTRESRPWDEVKGQYARIELENGVNSIGAWAFSDNNDLSSVSLPESLTEIGEGAFSSCLKLEELSLPAGLRSIGGEAFKSCPLLKSVAMQDGLVSIGEEAFFGCLSLNGLRIPDSVTGIGDNAFYYCNSLNAITLPQGLTAVGFNVFGACGALTEITIPEKVQTIDDKAFQNCSSLQTVHLPGSIKTIGALAFDGCGAIADVYYANSRTEWENIAIGGGNETLTKAELHCQA